MVVVVIVIVGVLALAGVFSPGSTSSQGLTGAPVSYNQVASMGAAAVHSESGGPWTLVGAVGIGLPTAVSGSIATNAVLNGCTSNPAPGSPAGGTLPATPTGSQPGAVAFWFFLGANSNGTLLVVAVTQTATAPLFLWSGSCASDYNQLGSLAGADVVNSTQIAASANTNGGSTFLSANPGAIETYVLFGPGLSHTEGTPYWAADYNTCGVATTGNGTAFVALYNATSGASFGHSHTEAINC